MIITPPPFPRHWAAALLLLGGIPTLLGAQSPSVRNRLQPGPMAVGFVVLSRVDSTRTVPSGEARPMQVGIWYPARPHSVRRLSYRDYYLMTPAGYPPAEFEATPQELGEFSRFLVSQGVSDSIVQAWLDAPMLAAAGAIARRGRYPLVLIAQGNGQMARDQAPLAEYLASYGYVVATSPSPMRLTGPMTSETEAGLRAEEQADDLSYLLAVLLARPDVIASRIGVIGHSFGARGALLFAMRERTVAALISLDGGIGTATARESFEAAPSFSAGAQVPILHFYEQLDRFMAPDFGLMRSLTAADRWLVPTTAMHHHHFTSLGAASVAIPSLRPALGASSVTAREYGAIAQATLDFLDAHLKAKATALNALSRGGAWPQLGPPEHLRPTAP